MCSNVLPFVPALLINAHHTACNCTTGLIFQVTLILNVYVYVNTIKLFSFVLFLGLHWLGIALQGMDDYEEAMVTFSQGLATNPKENAMLTALVETMLKSSLKGIVVIMITVENFPDICFPIMQSLTFTFVNLSGQIWLGRSNSKSNIKIGMLNLKGLKIVRTCFLIVIL